MGEEGGRSQLLGTGGTYYVMSQLAFKGYHASCTFGNAPYVDILVSAPDGAKTLAIQVKTAHDALRYRGRGANKKPNHLEFTLGRKLAKLNRENLIVAFVDMKGFSPGSVPDVYLVPTSFIFKYCKPWVDEVSWVRFHVDLAEMEPYKNKWDLVAAALG